MCAVGGRTPHRSDYLLHTRCGEYIAATKYLPMGPIIVEIYDTLCGRWDVCSLLPPSYIEPSVHFVVKSPPWHHRLLHTHQETS